MKLCHWSDLPDGESRGFDPAGHGQDTVIVVRQGPRLHAYANACPHHGVPMAWRKDRYLNAAGDRIVCAAHGALFDIATGVCTLGPCLGDALTPVPLVLQADGEVHLANPKNEQGDKPMSLSSHRILVIGGGFSGMAAAIELRKQGAQVDIVEIDPGWRSYGAGISLGGATLRALRRLGVLEAFLAQGNASDGVNLHLPHGPLVATLPTPRLAGGDVPGGGAILRPVLARILAEATRAAGAHVRLGCTFSAIDQEADGVQVTFTDGQRQRYDLVIGADGLYSKVRETVFENAPRPRYSGQAVWRAVLPRPPEIETATMWLGPRIKPGVNPVSKTEMYLFVTEPRPTNDHVDPATFVDTLRALLDGFAAPTLQAIRSQIGPDSQIVYRPLEGLLMPRPWSRGRVALIGDTVHATTPHLASGACIGIEDALVLADELAQAGGDVPAALAAFENRRWERCRMVVENSARLGEIEIEGGDKEEHSRIMRESLVALAEPI